MDVTNKMAGMLLTLMGMIKNTGAFLNTITEGILVMLIGGALYIFSYVVMASVINSAGTISNEQINTSMYAGEAQILQGLSIMGLVFIVVGLIVVVRAFLSIYGSTGGAGGRGA